MSKSLKQQFKRGRATPGNRVWFRVDTEPAEVFIYDEIGRGFEGGGLAPENFFSEVKALNLSDNDTLSIRINSPGGDLFDAFAVFNYLSAARFHVAVTVDGVAASAASIIAMAGDTIRMPENSFLFIHNPWSMVAGDAKVMRKMADDLDKMRDSAVQVYQRKIGNSVSREQLVKMLDDETWLNAAKSVELGFADEVEQPIQAAALSRFDLSRWRNLPSPLAAKAIERNDLRERREEKLREERAEIEHYASVLQSLR